MSEHDDELDRWIHRVVSAAGSDAPDHEELTASSVPAPRRRWPVAAAAAVLVALGIGAVVWTTRPDASSPSANPIPTESGNPSTVSSEPITAPSSTSSVAPVATEPATSTAPAVELARPIIDLEWCRPTWVRTRDFVFEGAYLWPRQRDMAIQVFVPTGGSVTGRFAVALRVTNNLLFATDMANAEVNGQPARSLFANPTWGELLWQLPDGSDAYLRTSTMTSDELIALADTLEPRQLTDPVPGFATTSTDYELAAEAITPITVSDSVMTACETDDGGWMFATVIDGPLPQALYLTDRPAVPMAVRALGDGRLLLVTGREDIADRSQEALDSVRDATDDEWAALTASATDDAEPATPASAGLRASAQFCSVARSAAEAHLAFDDPEQRAMLTDDPSLSEPDRGRVTAAVDEAGRTVGAGAYSNDQLVEVINDICSLDLTPVTMVP